MQNNNIEYYEFILKNRQIVLPITQNKMVIEKMYNESEIQIEANKISIDGTISQVNLQLEMSVQLGPKLCVFRKHRAFKKKIGYRRKYNVIMIREI